MKIFLYTSVLIAAYLLLSVLSVISNFAELPFMSQLGITPSIMYLLYISTTIPVLVVLKEGRIHIVFVAIHIALTVINYVLAYSPALARVDTVLTAMNGLSLLAFLISLLSIKSKEMTGLFKLYSGVSLILVLGRGVLPMLMSDFLSLPEWARHFVNSLVVLPVIILLCLNLKMLRVSVSKPEPEEPTDGSILSAYE